MCLLICKPADTELPDNLEKIVQEASEINSHGMGFATCGQSMKKFNMHHATFSSLLRENLTKADPAIIHWRLSTSGLKDDANCHPFRLNDGGFMAHNGVISSKYAPTQMKSDTRVLSEAFNTSEEMYEECQKLASSANKFAIITPDNQLKIAGECYGTWENKLWFSNMSWKGGYSRWQYDDYDIYDRRRGYGTRVSNQSTQGMSLKEQLAALVRTHGVGRVVEELDKYMAAWVLD